MNTAKANLCSPEAAGLGAWLAEGLKSKVEELGTSLDTCFPGRHGA